MAEHRKTIRAYDGERVDIKVRDPQAAAGAAAAKTQLPHPSIDRIRRYGRTVIRVFDLGTFCAKAPRNNVAYDSYFEIPLEGPTNLSVDDRERNRRRLLEEYGHRVTLESGEVVPSTYPLQVDEETATANVSIELRGTRGRRIRGLSIGSDRWLPPEPIEDQRESIAALRAGAIAQSNNSGLDEWGAKLDQREARRWSAAVAGRVDREGELRLMMAPGPVDLHFRSAWQYESFQLGDRHRYRCLRGHEELSAVYDPPPNLRLTRSRCTRVDIYAAPQLHDVQFEWIDVYILLAGWWIILITLPNVSRISLRSAQFPHTFTAAGVPEQGVTVGATMSERIARTQAFAAAIVRRVFSPIYHLIGSFQGRYGVYQRDQERGLCAVVEMKWPDIPPEVVTVYRRVLIARENLLLEVGALHVPGLVYGWIPGFSVEGEVNDGTIGDGF